MSKSVLGRVVSQEEISQGVQPEVVPCPPDTRVTFRTKEFTSRCPVTGQPDYGEVQIEFFSKGLTLESKSLKLYLQAFRDQGVFCETLPAAIGLVIWELLGKPDLWVEVTQKPRGGIGITATKIFSDPDSQTRWGLPIISSERGD